MPSAITRTSRNRPDRRRNGPNRPRPSTPIGILGITKNTTTMTIAFNQPVSLKGVPQYTTNLGGITAVSAALTTATVMVLTFSASVATATELRIPPEDPAVRNSSGGFVTPTTMPA